MRLYEGMFIVDPTGLGKDEGTPEDLVKGLLDRRRAEILHSERWAERKFCYDIEGKKKGVYVLAYFRAPSAEIRELVHDCELSDRILRVLVLRDRDGELEREMQLRKEALLSRPPAAPEGGAGEGEASLPSAEGEEKDGSVESRIGARRRVGIEELEDLEEGPEALPEEEGIEELEGLQPSDEPVDADFQDDAGDAEERDGGEEGDE